MLANRLLASCFVLAAAFCVSAEPLRWRGNVARGRVIEIRGVDGDVLAEGYDGADVDVTASISNEAGVDTPVKVEAVESEKGVTICAVYEGVDGRASRCLDDAAAEPSAGPRVNFTVRVPRGVSVIGRTVNGTVSAERLDSDVEAYTVNGKILISTRGSAQARTINGSIFASLGNPFYRSRADFSTVNGSITLNLPPCASTAVHAETVNGRVTTAFRLRNSALSNDKVIHGSIGTGANGSLKLKTVNGSIQVKKAG